MESILLDSKEPNTRRMLLDVTSMQCTPADRMAVV